MCSPNLLCPLCFQLSFPNIENLRRSLIKVANSPIICPLCNDTFLGLDKFTIHLFSHTDLSIEGQQNVECNINLKPDKLSLISGNQQTGLSYTSCPLVTQNQLKTVDKLGHNYYSTQSNVEKIGNEEKIIIHNSVLNDFPPASYQKSSAAVNDYNLTSTTEIITKPKCSKSLLNSYVDDSQTELILSTTGMKLNESAKEWECDICTKSFTTKYFLKKHKRLHTGEMPYSCEICGRTYTFQQSYHKHLLYHNDEKPHVCQTCNRSFKELSTLQNHERIHSGEKPFKCELCGKCFRQRVSFLVHTRIHTGAMPYECSVCKKKFRYKLSQRNHKCIAVNLQAEESKVPDPSYISDSASTSNMTLNEKDVGDGNKAYDMFDMCLKENPSAHPDTFNYIEKETELYRHSNQILSENFMDHNDTATIVNLIEQNFTNETSAIDNTLFSQFL